MSPHTTTLLHRNMNDGLIHLAIGRVDGKPLKWDNMNFAEFTYPLIQGWDWWFLYSTKAAQLQIGGSDQYKNIERGIDVVNYVRKHHYDPLLRQEQDDPLMVPMGLTTPLLKMHLGEEKMAKSYYGNALLLDTEITPITDQYQVSSRQPYSAVADSG